MPMSISERQSVAAVLDEVGEVLFALVMEHHFKGLGEIELTLAQAQLLRLVRREPLSTGQLARELGVSAPAVTQLCDRLFAKNLIQRRTSDTDRRSVVLDLTPEGRSLIDGLRRRRNLLMEELLSRLEPADKMVVTDALTRLAALARANPGSADLEAADRPSANETAIQVSGASNKGEGKPVIASPRRMRIEWD
jgi:DNA-binding MarR family transcriptional regulator